MMQLSAPAGSASRPRSKARRCDAALGPSGQREPSEIQSAEM